MTQTQKAKAFLALHTNGDPVVLYNVWDAGSAKAVAEAGAKAIATGSWSAAASQGYEDGQNMPLDVALGAVARIVRSTDLPVTVDFEGGFATHPDDVARNVASLLQIGAIGLNFEDQIVGGEGLYDKSTQAARIAAVRLAADHADVPAVINARTDLSSSKAMQQNTVISLMTRSAGLQSTKKQVPIASSSLAYPIKR